MFKDNKKIKTLFKIIIWLFIIAVCVFLYKTYSKDFDIFRNSEKMKTVILSYKQYGIIVFILLQIVQVVVFFIPGEVVQMAGGYIFGPVLGSIVSILGILLGSMICFYLARVIGRNNINRWIEEKKLHRIKRILEAGSNKVVIFAIYFIPGIPKDLLGYVSGVSGVDFSEFLIFSMLGRCPWIVASAMFGHGIGTGNYIAIIIISVISVVLFLIGVFKGNSIIEYLHKKREGKGHKSLK